MSRLRLGRSSGRQVTSGLQRSVTSLDAFSPRTPNAPAPGDRECRECRECRDSRLFVVVSVDVVVVADPGDPASMVSCLAGVEDHDHLPDSQSRWAVAVLGARVTPNLCPPIAPASGASGERSPAMWDWSSPLNGRGAQRSSSKERRGRGRLTGYGGGHPCPDDGEVMDFVAGQPAWVVAPGVDSVG